MEHRRYMRVPTDLDTLIFHRGLPVASGRIRDACRGGIFVETTFDDLHDHQRLECEFRVAQDRLRIGAHVLRHDPSGIALWIDDEDQSATAVLHALLASCGPVPVMRLPQTEIEPEPRAREFSPI